MKRNALSLIILLLVVISCDKGKEEINPIDCKVEISQNPDWNTENFKNNYTIQFPDNYEGHGMTGFEGNVFQKKRVDGKILFDYGFCSDTFCEDFGDPLAVPFPSAIIAKDLNGQDIALDSRKGFCLNGDIKGILYYNTEKDAVGKYFMKQGTGFVEALTIQFDITELQEVNSIISTIIQNEE
jgi:hypothetical protein